MHTLGNPKGRWTFVLKPRLKLNRNKENTAAPSVSVWAILGTPEND